MVEGWREGERGKSKGQGNKRQKKVTLEPGLRGSWKTLGTQSRAFGAITADQRIDKNRLELLS